ncbi:MAG: hypothetical protein RLZZ386_1605 [Planctomycetota bacterium]
MLSPADHSDPHGDPDAAHRTKFNLALNFALNFEQWNHACTSKGFANDYSREV